MAKRVPNPTGKGGFKKGQSGNAGGRPKEVAEVKALARRHTTEAIKTLVEIMVNQDARGSERVAAANAILDRGYGRPAQAVTDGDGGPVKLVIERVIFNDDD